MPEGNRHRDTEPSETGEAALDRRFEHLSRQWAAGLAHIVGESRVITDPDELAWASRDALDDYRAFGRPRTAAPVLVVVQPGTAQEVARVLAWASSRRIPVVPRGGGTGVMGATIPVKPAVAIDLSRLDEVRVDRENMRIEAGAGATLARVAQAAEAEGLLFAHDPWSLSIATVGGAISTNGMGYLFGPYGKMGDQVLALEVALADGTVLRTRPTLSGGPGPMLHKLFVGAEGIFGVITRAWLRAWPAPEAKRFASFRFDSFAAGFHAVAALWRAGIVPTVLDMSDTPPEPGDPALATLPADQVQREITELHVAFFGLRETVAALWERAERELAALGGKLLGSGPAENYWEERHSVAEEYERHVQRPRDWRQRSSRFRGFEYLNVELPMSQVLSYRKACLEYLQRYPELRAGETGLWGRPEIFSIVIHDVSGDERGAVAMREASDYLARLAQDLGGTMEAIHGPGAKLEPLLQREWGSAYDVIRAIKLSVDPAGILHAGRWA
ncbi:MAG: hypothetical protein BAA04_06795 [Firmicutes bacterium ZCTH02-B6]|nr:MAG: hypothetical protein BAA04_06795 [Firmicutes bacterium ZCTH02-B6]